MREIITLVICALLALVAFQTGLIRSGLDYDKVIKERENLQASNERLTDELQQVKGTSSSEAISAQAQMEKAKNEMEQELERELKNGSARLTLNHGRFLVSLIDRKIYVDQSDRLTPEGQELMTKVGRVLVHYPEMELKFIGYVDNRGLTGANLKRFGTLRQLSYSRALTAARWMGQTTSLDATQVMVAGFGDQRPLLANITENDRRQNRRLEIEMGTIDPAVLQNARDILRKEPSAESANPVQSEKKKAKKVTESENDEPLGEESLGDTNEDDFGAGYDRPGGK